MTDPKSTKAPKPANEPVVSALSTTPATESSTPPDANHGRGGMYTVVNGQRVLVGRTQAEHEAEAADATQPATLVKPATTE